MDKFQKQAVLIVIQTLESQLAALRSLIGLADVPVNGVAKHQRPDPFQPSFTSAEEDHEIEIALKFEDQKDEILQDIFERAKEKSEG